MIKEFEKNLIYTFSKEKFKESPTSDDFEQQLKEEALKSGIADKLHGYEVEVINNLTGKIPVIVAGTIRKDAYILPHWCEAWWKYEEV